MFKLIALVFNAGIAIVLSNQCHVADDETAIHCADVNNMTCKDVNYIPYCHKGIRLQGDLNGVCSCEKLCFTDHECQAGCLSPSERRVCTEAYTNSLERFCLCQRSQ